MASPERVYITLTDDKPQTLTELKHMTRYAFAFQFAEGEILDIACGSGYGSAMLSEHGSVLGVDCSADAIEFAKKENINSAITFTNERIEDFSPTTKVDTIVCLETFEHLRPVIGFDLLTNFVDWINPGGHIILSTPMLRFKEGKPYVTNPYHINELPKDKFMRQVRHIFKGFNLAFFHQDVSRFRLLEKEDTGFCIMVARKR